jgi:hypothetical protein
LTLPPGCHVTAKRGSQYGHLHCTKRSAVQVWHKPANKPTTRNERKITMFARLFKNRYPAETFRGQAWLRNVDHEDRKAFGRIGNTASNYGIEGGRALVSKYHQKDAKGKNAHMSKIGKMGAAATKRLREANRLMEEIEAANPATEI